MVSAKTSPLLGYLYLEFIGEHGYWRLRLEVRKPIKAMTYWIRSRRERGLPPILTSKRRFRPTIFLNSLEEVDAELVEEAVRLIDGEGRILHWWVEDSEGRLLKEVGKRELPLESLLEERSRERVRRKTRRPPTPEEILHFLRSMGGLAKRVQLGKTFKVYGEALDRSLKPLLEEGIIEELKTRRGGRLYRLLAP